MMDMKRRFIQALRLLLWRYDPERRAAIEYHKIKIPVKKMDGTLSKKYTVGWRCTSCKKIYAKVDWHHIEEVGEEPQWPPVAEDVGRYIERMFCPSTGYTPLCKPCHKVITNRARRK